MSVVDRFFEKEWACFVAGFLAILVIVVAASIDYESEQKTALRAALIEADKTYRANLDAERSRDICAEIENAIRKEGRQYLAERGM